MNILLEFIPWFYQLAFWTVHSSLINRFVHSLWWSKTQVSIRGSRLKTCLCFRPSTLQTLWSLSSSDSASHHCFQLPFSGCNALCKRIGMRSRCCRILWLKFQFLWGSSRQSLSCCRPTSCPICGTSAWTSVCRSFWGLWGTLSTWSWVSSGWCRVLSASTRSCWAWISTLEQTRFGWTATWLWSGCSWLAFCLFCTFWSLLSLEKMAACSVRSNPQRSRSIEKL